MNHGLASARWWCIVGLLLVGAGGACRNSSRSPRPATPEEAAAAARGAASAVVHGGAGLPAVCDHYRRKLLECMESRQFPAAAREGQRLALEQMMAIVRGEQAQGDGGADAVAAATNNCRDSLSTLAESAKVTCPAVVF